MLTTILAALAPTLFRVAESKFGAKSGSTKMAAVTDAAAAFVDKLAASGDLKQAAPTREELVAILEKILAAEKEKPDWSEKGVLELAGAKYIVTVVGKVA